VRECVTKQKINSQDYFTGFTILKSSKCKWGPTEWVHRRFGGIFFF
jgi:hypothetical protein